MTCISLTANSVSDPDAWLASELADARDDDDDDDAASATRRASGIDGGDAGDDEDAREGRGAGR